MTPQERQLIDDLFGPAAPIGVLLQQMLGGEHTAGFACRDLTLEVRLAAEQPEPAPDLPVDRKAGVGLLLNSRRLDQRFGLCDGAAAGEGGGEEGGQSRKDCEAHGCPISRCGVLAPGLRRK